MCIQPRAAFTRDQRSTATLLLVLLGIIVGLGCKKAKPDPKNQADAGTPIDLSAIVGPNQVQMFSEVKRPGLLPKPVVDYFNQSDGIAGPGEDFNLGDVTDGRVPSRMLVTAAVSKQYCIVSYWQGGFKIRFQTDIFELSDGKAEVIWVSDQQGGFNFRDLKKMVESGRMHNDLRK
jgi:hypothetical protein